MKTAINILPLLIFLFNSCVKEKDIFNNEVILNSQDVMKTSKFFSFLNEEYRLNSINTENCFTFNYPIQLGYNTEQIFTIDNAKALEEIANSQSSNLYVNCVVLPIYITNTVDGTISEINNLRELYNTFEQCNVSSFKSVLFEKAENCLDFQYPFEMFNTGDEKVKINDIEQFYSFLNSNESRLAPKFVYPLTFNENNSANNYYDLYESLNSCLIEEISCFEPSISGTELNTNNYNFEVETNSTISQILWTFYLNNEIEYEYLELRNGINTYNYTFIKSGIWDICANVTIEDIDCPLENSTEEVCYTGINISVLDVINGQPIQNPIVPDGDPCTNLSYSYIEIERNLYEFYPLIDSQESTDEFLWTVTLNDSEVSTSNTTIFQYEFTEPGIYIVCAKVEETTDCSTGVSFCTDFTATTSFINN